MTVENTQNKMPPLQMGTTNEYPFNFAVLLQDPTAEEALEAIKASVLQADGTEVELVYNTDYTVTLNTDRIGGTLTVNDIRTSSDYITIYRQYEQTQEVDYKDFNSAPAETFEQCFDKLTMLSQQQQEEINRSIKLPVSSDITKLSLPNPVAGRTLKWNESETGLINSDVSIDEIDDSVQTALEASINATQQAEIASDAAKEVVEKVSEVDNIWSEIVEGNMFKLQIFDPVVKDHILTYEESKGLALQGTWVYKNAIAGERWGYPDFYAKVIEEYNEATVTETVNGVTVKVHSNGHKFYDIANKSAIDSSFNSLGTAWYYGVDTANERVFLPRDKYFAVNGVAPVVGNGMALGLLGGESGTSTGALVYTSEGFGVRTGMYGQPLATKYGSGEFAINYTSGVTDDPTKSGIEAHLKANEDKYLYICVGNTVADTSWVDVVTQVEGGVLDLENATNEGLSALANASNALRQTQVTNCLLEVPQRIKYDLTDGTLTIKAGSVVIVPYGTEDLTSQYPKGATFINNNFKVYDAQFTDGKFFVWAELVEDISLPRAGTVTSTDSILLIDLPALTLTYCNTTGALSGNDYTSAGGYKYYELSTNKMYARGTVSATYNETIASLPIMTFERQEGVIASINQVFNGMGYIGSTVWVDKGVRALLTNGRNKDGTLNNIDYINDKLVFRNGISVGDRALIFSPYRTGYPITTLLSSELYGAKYDEKTNSYPSYNGAWFATAITDSNGVITSFQPKQPFRAMDSSTPHITETYVSGTSGYRIWSDKYCEQWGYIASVTRQASVTITLLKTFNSTNYRVFCTGDASIQASDDGSGNVHTKTTSSFNLFNSSSNDVGYYWEAKGYIN